MLLNNVLLIFLKYPRAGLVKRMLAVDIGTDMAVSVYRSCAEVILKKTEDKSFSRLIFYEPEDKKRELVRWLGADLDFFCKEVFENIPWGESDVLEKTQDKLSKMGVEFGLLEPQIDIDRVSDLYLLERQITERRP